MSGDAEYLENKLTPIIKNKKYILPENYRGEAFYSDKNGFADIVYIAKSWMKNNRRQNNQNFYLEEIIKKAKENNHNLYFVIPPLRKDLKLLLPKKDIIFNCLYEIALNNKCINLIDTYDSEDFDILDFEDCDHLSKIGASKLTSIIKSKIADTTKKQLCFS